MEKSGAAFEKLVGNLDRYNLWSEDLRSRIVPIVGDLSEDRLGIPDSQWEKLAVEITDIVHCGTWVNAMFDYYTLKPINVLGTVGILQLASQHHIKV